MNNTARRLFRWASITIILAAVVGVFFVNRFASMHMMHADHAGPITASIALSPRQPEANTPAQLSFQFSNSDGDEAVLVRHHDRLVHTMIVSEDLNNFAHLHPEDFTERSEAVEDWPQYGIEFEFPKAGRYLVATDVMTMTSTLAKQFPVVVAGSGTMGEISRNRDKLKCFRGYSASGVDRYVQSVNVDDARVACPNGFAVRFHTSPKSARAGEQIQLHYSVERGGSPVTDLAPYLGAAIHFAIVPASFDTLLHHHGRPAGMPEQKITMTPVPKRGGMSGMQHMMPGMHHPPPPDAFGPDLVSESIVLPHEGAYKIFAQFKHDGQIVFTDFMLDASEALPLDATVRLNLDIRSRVMQPARLEISRGDTVDLTIQGDEAAQFHITGYEIEQAMQPGETTKVRFTAVHAGQFSLELHPDATPGADIPIGLLIVNP